MSCGCHFEYVTMRSYVYEYYDYNDINVSYCYPTSYQKNYDNNGLVPASYSQPDSNIIFIYVQQRVNYCNYLSGGKQKILYDSLCSVHNDMYYNKKEMAKDGIALGIHMNFSSDIKRIDVISNKDFDEQHLAGAFLNDIILFCSITPYSYIKSNYKEEFNWADYVNNGGRVLTNFRLNDGDYPIEKKLSILNQEDFTLAGNSKMIGNLVFTQEPTLEQTHNLTITIELLDGRVFNKNITKIFN